MPSSDGTEADLEYRTQILFRKQNNRNILSPDHSASAKSVSCFHEVPTSGFVLLENIVARGMSSGRNV
jgi:hypothetical protein